MINKQRNLLIRRVLKISLDLLRVIWTKDGTLNPRRMLRHGKSFVWAL